ncbi:pancreatic triacylglycerol lipase [Caerostris extrusa]|uniref:Pancreatic triacylglycerol lipase n=1 Tax=Caerostris extrusa TaxID=172846 RepID=A0AAV4VQH2_CAEEX|nr:pancreatic triacylglycerol lipase [Caerostris extrusa]
MHFKISRTHLSFKGNSGHNKVNNKRTFCKRTLDPAGPRFYDAPLEERLDPSDALFVDAIHTDAGHGLIEGLGLRSQVGHVDFYPNGGKDQPGCHSSPFTILPRIGIHRAARYYVTCDHFRSVEYYIDSIQSSVQPRFGEPSCQFVGVACRDWETYAQGRCADCSHDGSCATMGYLSDQNAERGSDVSRHDYYTKTADEEPYCLFQYQVIVETGCGHEYCPEATESTAGYNLGAIRMELQTRDGKLARLNMDENVDQEVKPGAQYVYLATSRFPLGEIRGAKVWWGRSSKPEAPPTFRSISIPLNLKKCKWFQLICLKKIKRFSIPETTVLCGSPEKSFRRINSWT